jgi:hypothetical protein
MWFGSVCKVWEMYKQALINSLKSISAVPQNDSQEETQRISEEKKEARQVAHASTHIAEAVNQTMDVYSLILPGYGATRAAVEGDVGGALLEGASSLFPGGKLGSKLIIRSDVIIKGGRSGQMLKNAIGPANSVVKGGSEGRVLVTNQMGQVVWDITKDRVKQVVPGSGFGPKSTPTQEQINLIKQVWGK